MSMPRPVIGNDVESGLSVVQEFYSEFFGILVPGMLFLLFLCLTIVCQSQFYFNLEVKDIISLFRELFKSDKIGSVLLFSVFFFIILSYAFGSILYQRSVKDIDRISAFRLWKRSKRSSRNTLAVQFPEWPWGSLINSIFKSIGKTKEDSDNSQNKKSQRIIDYIFAILIFIFLIFQKFHPDWNNINTLKKNDLNTFSIICERVFIPFFIILLVQTIVVDILGKKLKWQRKVFVYALFLTISFFISVIISYITHSECGNQTFINDINFPCFLFICIAIILLVATIFGYFSKDCFVLESLKKFLLYFNINKMIYFFSEVPKDYPYPYLRQYFIVRDKMNLLKYVPWCADTSALHQTKSTMNELKTCINYSGNQLFSYDILKNEATTRSLAACWSAAQYLLIWNMVAFAVYHLFIFVSLNRSVFITKTFGSYQKYLLFAIMVLLLHWIHRLIEEEFHRVRTREITTIFNNAYILENSENDSGTNAFFDTINKRYDSFCNNTIINECKNDLNQLRDKFLDSVKNAIKQGEIDFRNKIIEICKSDADKVEQYLKSLKKGNCESRNTFLDSVKNAIKQGEIDFRNKIIEICKSDADKVEQYLKSLKNENCGLRNYFIFSVKNASTDSNFYNKITEIITTINADGNVIQFLGGLNNGMNDELYTKFINLLIESFTNFEGKFFKIIKKCNNADVGNNVEQYFESLKINKNKDNENKNKDNKVDDPRTEYTDFVDLFLKEFKDFEPLPPDIKEIINEKRFKKQKYCYYCIDDALAFQEAFKEDPSKKTTNYNGELYICQQCQSISMSAPPIASA